MINKVISIVLVAVFLLGQIEVSWAQRVPMPSVGPIAVTPTLLKGVKVDPSNPMRMEFIISDQLSADSAQEEVDSRKLRAESRKLIKYFLAALTTPEDEMWVNLSPYESDRIVPEGFGQTEMGRDLLAQDYLLKQLTSSLLHPDNEHGKKFWDKVYAEAFEKYGTTEVPMETFHKVWIVPDQAEIFERTNDQRPMTNEKSMVTSHVSVVGYVTKARMKVLLERDYVAVQQTNDQRQMTNEHSAKPNGKSMVTGHVSLVDSDDLSSEIMREIIIPAIEDEVNEGETFALLRQIYHSMILATWYKRKLKSDTGYVVGGTQDQQPQDVKRRSTYHVPLSTYIDSNKTAGVEHGDVQAIPNIYDQYVNAFKQGAHDFIRDEMTNDQRPMTNGKPLVTGHTSVVSSRDIVPRRYFSGGAAFKFRDGAMTTTSRVPQGTGRDRAVVTDLLMLKLKDKAMEVRSEDEAEMDVSPEDLFGRDKKIPDNRVLLEQELSAASTVRAVARRHNERYYLEISEHDDTSSLSRNITIVVRDHDGRFLGGASMYSDEEGIKGVDIDKPLRRLGMLRVLINLFLHAHPQHLQTSAAMRNFKLQHYLRQEYGFKEVKTYESLIDAQRVWFRELTESERTEADRRRLAELSGRGIPDIEQRIDMRYQAFFVSSTDWWRFGLWDPGKLQYQAHDIDVDAAQFRDLGGEAAFKPLTFKIPLAVLDYEKYQSALNEVKVEVDDAMTVNKLESDLEGFMEKLFLDNAVKGASLKFRERASGLNQSKHKQLVQNTRAWLEEKGIEFESGQSYLNRTKKIGVLTHVLQAINKRKNDADTGAISFEDKTYEEIYGEAPPSGVVFQQKPLDVFIPGDIYLGKEGKSPVRFAFLGGSHEELGRPVVIKRIVFEEYLLELIAEARHGIILNRLGWGAHVHGFALDAEGAINLVMDIAPGRINYPAWETQETLRQRQKLQQDLDSAGYALGRHDYMVDREGNIALFDFEEAVQDKAMSADPNWEGDNDPDEGIDDISPNLAKILIANLEREQIMLREWMELVYRNRNPELTRLARGVWSGLVDKALEREEIQEHIRHVVSNATVFIVNDLPNVSVLLTKDKHMRHPVILISDKLYRTITAGQRSVLLGYILAQLIYGDVHYTAENGYISSYKEKELLLVEVENTAMLLGIWLAFQVNGDDIKDSDVEKFISDLSSIQQEVNPLMGLSPVLASTLEESLDPEWGSSEMELFTLYLQALRKDGWAGFENNLFSPPWDVRIVPQPINIDDELQPQQLEFDFDDDGAMVGVNAEKGGIDFNPDSLNLQVNGDDAMPSFNIDHALLNINPDIVTGIDPVIVEVLPIRHLPTYLTAQ